MVGVAELESQAGQGHRGARAQPLCRLEQAVALNHPLGMDADVRSEAPLQRAHVEPGDRGDLVDAGERTARGDVLDQIAHGGNGRRHRGHHLAQKRLGERDLGVQASRTLELSRPILGSSPEDVHGGHRAIGEPRQGRPQQRLEGRRPKLHDEEPSTVRATAPEPARPHAGNLRAKGLALGLEFDACRRVGQCLGDVRRAQVPLHRAVVVDERSEIGRGQHAPTLEATVGHARPQHTSCWRGRTQLESVFGHGHATMPELSRFNNPRDSARANAEDSHCSRTVRCTMPISGYDASVALFLRALTNLKELLHKAERHALSRNGRVSELLGSRLASDMHGLASQVHWAGEGAKLAVARLVGAPLTMSRDDAETFGALQQRLDATLAHLRAVAADEIEAGLGRLIELEHRGETMRFAGERSLCELAIPSFFFHLTTAYAILRHEGVELTKGDFLGSFAEASSTPEMATTPIVPGITKED